MVVAPPVPQGESRAPTVDGGFSLPGTRGERYTAPTMLKNAFKFASLPLLLVALLSGYAVLWFFGADSLKTAADAWLATQRENGWTIRHQGLEVSGFPLKIRVTLAAPHIAPPPGLGDWVLEADSLRLDAMVWETAAPALRSPAPLRLDLGRDGRWQIDGKTLEARVHTTSDGAVEGVSVAVEALTAVPFSALDASGTPRQDAPALTLDRLDGAWTRLETPEPVDIKTAVFSLALSGKGLTLPPDSRAPLGRTWSELLLDARVLGPLAEDRSFYDALLQWRDDGGVVEVDRLYADWPPLEISVGGTLALDDAMQPVGALSSHVAGFFDALARLEEQDVVRARDATMARVVLGTLAQNAHQGEKGPVMTLPLTIQNRQVSLGPVSLFEVPRVNWKRLAPTAASPLEVYQSRPRYEVDRFGNIRERD